MAGAGLVSILIALKPPTFLVISILWAFGLAGVTVAPLVILGVWWKQANRYGATAAAIVAGGTYILVSPYVIPSFTIAGGLPAKLGMSGALLCVPLSFLVLSVVSMITNKMPALMEKIPHEEDKKLVDGIHGWTVYNEERYNSTMAGVLVSGVSLFFVIWSLTPGGW